MAGTKVRTARPTAARRSHLIAAGCAIALIAAGCGRAANREAEHRIVEALPDLIGPARTYEVHVSGPGDATMRGHLHLVTVDAADVVLANGMLVDRLSVNLSDVVYDGRRHALESVGTAGFRAVIGEAAVNEYLAGSLSGSDPTGPIHVHILQGNQVRVDTHRVLAGVRVPISIDGTIHVASWQRAGIDPTGLRVIGVPVGSLIPGFLLRRLGAAIDLAPLPIPVTVTGVSTLPGQLVISGNIDSVEAASRLAARREMHPPPPR